MSETKKIPTTSVFDGHHYFSTPDYPFQNRPDLREEFLAHARAMAAKKKTQQMSLQNPTNFLGQEQPFLPTSPMPAIPQLGDGGGYSMQDLQNALPDFWKFLTALEGRPVTGGNKGSYGNPDLTAERVMRDRNLANDVLQNAHDNYFREQDIMDQGRAKFNARRAARDEAFRRAMIERDKSYTTTQNMGGPQMTLEQIQQRTKQFPNARINGKPMDQAFVQSRQAQKENQAVDDLMYEMFYNGRRPASDPAAPQTNIVNRTTRHAGYLERNRNNPYFQKYMQSPEVVSLAGGDGSKVGPKTPPAILDSERPELQDEEVDNKNLETPLNLPTKQDIARSGRGLGEFLFDNSIEPNQTMAKILFGTNYPNEKQEKSADMLFQAEMKRLRDKLIEEELFNLIPKQDNSAVVNPYPNFNTEANNIENQLAIDANKQLKRAGFAPNASTIPITELQLTPQNKMFPFSFLPDVRMPDITSDDFLTNEDFYDMFLPNKSVESNFPLFTDEPVPELTTQEKYNKGIIDHLLENYGLKNLNVPIY